MQNYKVEREVKKRDLTRRSPSRSRRSTLDCSVIEEEHYDDDDDDDDVPCTLNNYMRTFCAPSQTLTSFILARNLLASNILHTAHPQNTPLLFMKDFSALPFRYLVMSLSKNTQYPSYYFHKIKSPVAHQLLPFQIDF